jgi:hypothetical protein
MLNVEYSEIAESRRALGVCARRAESKRALHESGDRDRT